MCFVSFVSCLKRCGIVDYAASRMACARCAREEPTIPVRKIAAKIDKFSLTESILATKNSLIIKKLT